MFPLMNVLGCTFDEVLLLDMDRHRIMISRGLPSVGEKQVKYSMA